MGNWIISPDDGVEILGNGKFILPCETSDVTYTIQYIDGTCSSNTLTYVYATSGSCTPTPTGECPTSSTGIIKVGSYIGAAGGNNMPINLWIKENEVYTSHTVTSTDTSIISNFTDGQLYQEGDREIKANVASNESSDFRRYVDVTVTVFGPTLPSTGCSFSITLTQEGSCATIDSTKYVGPMHNYELDGTAQTGAAIVYVPYITPYSTTAWTTSYFYGTYSFVRNLTVIEGGGGPEGTRSMTVDIDENNTGADRTFKVRLVGNKTDGGQCTKTVEITQKPYSSPSVCDCDDLVINGTSSYATVTFINSSNNFASVTVGNVGFSIFDESSVSHPFTVNFGNISLSPGQSKSLKVDIDGAQGTVLGVTAVLDGVSEVFVKSKTQQTDRWITDNTNDDGTLEYDNTITLTHFEE